MACNTNIRKWDINVGLFNCNMTITALHERMLEYWEASVLIAGSIAPFILIIY